MKRILALTLPLVFSATAFGGGFTLGDLVVTVVGSGSSLNANATVGTLREFTTGGTFVQDVGLPQAASGGNAALTYSGSATSEGFISLSADHNYLTVVGYNAVPGTLAVATATPTTVNRVVGVVSVATGSINTTTILTDSYNGSNIRSATSTDGTSLWTAGNGGSGMGSTAANRYTTVGGTSAVQLNSTTSNMRVVNVFNGQLYASSSSTPQYGVAMVGTGLPTTTGQTLTELPGMPTSGTHSAYDFWFKDANTLYVADDGGASSGGGIQKWMLSGGTWSLAYTLLNNGTTTTACRGLTGMVDGLGNTELFATSSASGTPLIEVTDTGAGAIATTLATAASGYAFRDVQFLPTQIPEPSSFGLAGLGLLVMAAYRRLRR